MREFIRLEHEREDIGILLAAQTSWVVLGHRLPDSLEKVADRQGVPIGKKRTADQRRRRFASVQVCAVAGGALLSVDCSAAFGLIFGVDSVPDGARGLRESQSGDGHRDEPSRPHSAAGSVNARYSPE